MLKLILGVIAGFIVWTLIFVGGDALIRAIAPSVVAPADAAYVGSIGILLGYLLRSVIASVLAGLMAALIAGENAKSTLILGVVLLAVGVMVQIGSWNMLPAWYHIVFLVLLIPMTILGGRLKK